MQRRVAARVGRLRLRSRVRRRRSLLYMHQGGRSIGWQLRPRARHLVLCLARQEQWPLQLAQPLLHRSLLRQHRAGRPDEGRKLRPRGAHARGECQHRADRHQDRPHGERLGGSAQKRPRHGDDDGRRHHGQRQGPANRSAIPGSVFRVVVHDVACICREHQQKCGEPKCQNSNDPAIPSIIRKLLLNNFDHGLSRHCPCLNAGKVDILLVDSPCEQFIRALRREGTDGFCVCNCEPELDVVVVWRFGV
mmetsp:Transcript_137151/g.438585  ORF Transcript_137151/g.438585 Transcript_137151/m.438585 type:complete len:249 (-) Transcript_137151:705-1451(-)